MRILVSLILVLSLCLCAVSAPAESDEYEFLISDWKYVTGAEDAGQAEKTIFFYDDYDFEILDSEENSEEGTWAFDGDTLVLTFSGKKVTLAWNEEAYQFSGEDSGAPVTIRVAEEDEGSVTAGPVGGWAAAEDWAVSDQVSAAVGKAQEQLMGVDYVPVALLGSQVVAGTNYAVLCRATVVAPDAQPRWVVMYLYEDLEGNVSVLSIEDLVLEPGL